MLRGDDMRIVNCVRCKQAFAMTKEPICPECIAKEEQEFELVKEYLDDNRGATMEDISEATGVSIKRIQKFLKDGRLEGIEGSGLKCRKCGVPITKGTYCQKCAKKLQANLVGAQGTEVQAESVEEKSKINLMKAKHIGR